MRSTQTFLFAPALSVLLAASAPADDYPVTSDPLYRSMGVMTHLGDKKIRADLKLTPEQDRAVVAVVNGGWGWYRAVTPDELTKVAGPNRDAKIRALFARRADETFAAAGRVLRMALT